VKIIVSPVQLIPTEELPLHVLALMDSSMMELKSVNHATSIVLLVPLLPQIVLLVLKEESTHLPVTAQPENSLTLTANVSHVHINVKPVQLLLTIVSFVLKTELTPQNVLAHLDTSITKNQNVLPVLEDVTLVHLAEIVLLVLPEEWTPLLVLVQSEPPNNALPNPTPFVMKVVDPQPVSLVTILVLNALDKPTIVPFVPETELTPQNVLAHQDTMILVLLIAQSVTLNV